MATCNCCGAELTPKDKFCWQCGTKVEQKLYCTNCGAELTPKDKFCWQCGTPAPAPAAPARVRPASFQASPANPAPVRQASFQPAPAPQTVGNLEDTYPNVMGFYEGIGNKRISISDRAIVWANGNGTKLYRLDAQDHMLSKDMTSSIRSIVQTPTNILLLVGGISGNLYVEELDDNLQTCSTREMMDDSFEEVALTEHYVFGTRKSTEDGRYIFFRLSLDEDGAEGISGPSACIDDMRITLVSNLLADGGTLYVTGYMEGSYSAWGIFACDFENHALKLLWRDSKQSFSGKPHFLDFARKIMWTELTEAEANANGIEYNYQERLLVARKIMPNAAILPQSPIIHAKTDYGFNYFDGENHFTAGNSCNFYAHTSHGTVTWYENDHGNATNTVIWPQQGLVIADFYDQGVFTIYPLNYNPEAGIFEYGQLTPAEV